MAARARGTEAKLKWELLVTTTFTADKIALLMIGGASLVTSIVALVVTYRQKTGQDRLSNRKMLSDIISAITDTNIAMAKSMAEPVSESVMRLRRSLNSHRRNLCQHADLMTREITGLASDIDHSVIAGAMEASGDIDRAEEHWEMAIESAPAPITRVYNLRGYARLLLSLGRMQAARTVYQDALEAVGNDDDRCRRERADTLVLWALAERDLGFIAEADRLRDQAIAEARRIGSSSSRNDMLQYIDSHWAAARDSALTSLP